MCCKSEKTGEEAVVRFCRHQAIIIVEEGRKF
jgi:hypothetical protein